MASYVNGQGGTMTIGSATLPVDTWTINVTAEALDTTTTADSGWANFIVGIKGADITAKTWFDTSTVPTGATPNIVNGASATFVLPIAGSAHQFSCTAIITQISVENAAKGAVTFSLNAKATGVVTLPT